MTNPPAHGEPDSGAYPYGPAAPRSADAPQPPPEAAGADPTSATTAEMFAATDADFELDPAARMIRAQIRTLKAVSFIALVVGSIGMLAAVIAEDSFDIGRNDLLLISIALFIIVTVPPTVLLVLGRRHKRREATRGSAISATVAGVICLLLGLITVGPTLVGTATAEIRDAIARTRPVTAAETAYSPADLAVEYQELVDTAAAAGGGVPKAGSDPLVRDHLCQLGNLDNGRSLSGTNFYLTALSADDALDAIEAAWNETGYSTQRYAEGEYPVDDYEDPDYLDHDDPMVTTEGGPFTWASAYVFDGYDAEGQLRLYVDYETICVAE
jgi:hypothetical protein